MSLSTISDTDGWEKIKHIVEMTVPELKDEINSRNNETRQPNLSCKGKRAELQLTLLKDNKALLWDTSMYRIMMKDKDELRLLKKENADYKEEIDTLRKEIVRVRDQRKLDYNKVLQYSGDLEKKNREVTRLQDAKTNLEIELQRIRTLNTTKATEIDTLKKDLVRVRGQRDFNLRSLKRYKDIFAKSDPTSQLIRSLHTTMASDDRREIKAAKAVLASAKSRESIALQLSSLSNKAHEKASSDFAILQQETKEVKLELRRSKPVF